MEYSGQRYKTPDTPCKGCQKRYPACHDHCEEYKKVIDDWIEYRREIRRRKHNHKEFDHFRVENTVKYVDKHRR